MGLTDKVNDNINSLFVRKFLNFCSKILCLVVYGMGSAVFYSKEPVEFFLGGCCSRDRTPKNTSNETEYGSWYSRAPNTG